MARPRRPFPPPMQTNDVRVAAVGTAAWAVALIVLLLLRLPAPDRWWLWVCVTGMATGLFGVLYIPRLQRSRASLLTRHAAGQDSLDAPAGPPDKEGVEPGHDGTARAGAAGETPRRGDTPHGTAGTRSARPHGDVPAAGTARPGQARAPDGPGDAPTRHDAPFTDAGGPE